MKLFNLSEIKRFFAVAILFAAAIFLFSQPIAACGWDYSIWQVRSKNADPLYRFIKGKKAGYIDQTGKIVIAPTLRFYGNSGDEFFDGLLFTSIGDGPYIDKTGKVALDTKYYRNWDFSEGLAVAMEKDNDKWGYMDKTGKFVISPRFESNQSNYVYSFSDGLAMIEVKDKYGYIDRTGEFVIEPKLLRGTDFNEGFARVVVEGPCLYVGDDLCAMFNGETIGGEDKYQEAEMCKFAFIDKTGAFISDERFVRAGDFSEGMAAVIQNGKWNVFEPDANWGYVDTTGKTVIKPQFNDAKLFSDGLAAVKIEKKWGFINKQGEMVIKPQFDTVEDFSDGLAPVGNWNEKARGYDEYYFINKQGKRAFPDTFAMASHYFKGIAHVKLLDPVNPENNLYTDGKYAYIDVSGKKIFTYERESGKDKVKK